MVGSRRKTSKHRAYTFSHTQGHNSQTEGALEWRPLRILRGGRGAERVGVGDAVGVAGGGGADVTIEQIAAAKYLRMNVVKNPNATELQYIIEVTSTLADPLSWSTAGLVTETNTATQLTVRDGTATTSLARRFMRLRIVKP